MVDGRGKERSDGNPSYPDGWNGFRTEVIDRLARIETKLNDLPCGLYHQRIERLEVNQGRYLALTIAVVIVLSMIFSKLPWPFP